MIELKEHVVQVNVLISGRFNLVEMRRNVADLIEVLRSDLANMQVNHMAVVGINLCKFFLSELLGIYESLNMNVLVRKNH